MSGKIGNAPNVAGEELKKLAGMICAVEFSTRRLLGYGSSWDEAIKMVAVQGFSNRQFYKYKVPSVVGDLQVTVEDPNINLNDESAKEISSPEGTLAKDVGT